MKPAKVVPINNDKDNNDKVLQEGASLLRLSQVPDEECKGTQMFAAIEETMAIQKRRTVFTVMWEFSLDPQGPFHSVWDAIIFLLVLFSACWEVYSLSFYTDRPEDDLPDWITRMFDLFFFVDILINFYTGYDTGYKVEHDKKLVAKRYLKTWFLIDFISTVPWGAITGDGNDKNAVVSVLRCLKVLRLFRLSRLLQRLTMSLNFHSSFIEASKFFLYVFIVAHILACFFFVLPALLGNTETDSWRAQIDGLNTDLEPSQQYVYSLYWALTTMTTVGYGDIKPKSKQEMWYVMFSEVFGLCIFALLVTQITNVNEAFGQEEKKHNGWKDDAMAFLHSTGIEAVDKKALVIKIREFLRFKSKSNYHSFTDGDERFSCLSYALKDEIRKEIFLPAILKVKMFLDEEEVDEMQRLNDKLDTDDIKGWIDENEFGEVLRGLDVNLNKEQIHAAMRQMGMNSEGMVSITNFNWWWHMQKHGVPSFDFPLIFLDSMAARLRALAFSPDDTIIERGLYGLKWFIVLTGRVIVQKRSYMDEATTKGSVVTKKNNRLTDLTDSPRIKDSPMALPRNLGVAPAISTPNAEERADATSLAGDEEGSPVRSATMSEGGEDGEVPVCSTSRYPIFGMIAGLPDRQYTMMRDRTRRWGVRVDSSKDVGKTNFCDVCYIDRFDLLQLFDACWGIGPDKMLSFARCYYNVSDVGMRKVDEAADEADKEAEPDDDMTILNINTAQYQDRNKIMRLRKRLTKLVGAGHEHHKADTHHSEEAMEAKATADDVLTLPIMACQNALHSMTHTLALATKLNEARLKIIEGNVQHLQDRVNRHQ